MAQMIAADHGGPAPLTARAPRPAPSAGAGSAFAAVIGARADHPREKEQAEADRPHAGAGREPDDAPDGAVGSPGEAAPATGRGGRDAGHHDPDDGPDDGRDSAEPQPAQRMAEGGQAGAGTVASDDPDGFLTRAGGRSTPAWALPKAPATPPAGTVGATLPADGRPASVPVAAVSLSGMTALSGMLPRLDAASTLPAAEPAPEGPKQQSALKAASALQPPPPAKAGPPAPLQRPFAAQGTVTAEIMARAVAASARRPAADGGADLAGAGAAPQGGAPAPPAAAMPAAAPPLPPSAIIAQITQALNTAAPATIELTLQPRELGRLRLVLRPAEGARDITVLLGAERAETLDLLRRHAGMLEGALRDLGFTRARLDFTALSSGGAATGGIGAGDSGGGPAGEGLDRRAEHDGVPPRPDRPSQTRAAAPAPPRTGPVSDHLDMRL